MSTSRVYEPIYTVKNLYNLYYTSWCLEYIHLFSIFTIRPLNREDTDLLLLCTCNAIMMHVHITSFYNNIYIYICIYLQFVSDDGNGGLLATQAPGSCKPEQSAIGVADEYPTSRFILSARMGSSCICLFVPHIETKCTYMHLCLCLSVGSVGLLFMLQVVLLILTI